MKRTGMITLSLAFLMVFLAAAGEDAPGVEDAVIALQVADREPVGAATSFRGDVGELVCFTRIVGAEDTTVQHVWFHGEKEVARVELPVRGSSWRTWSKKRILPSWTGDWRVEIQGADGNVLETVSFVIGSETAAEG